MQLNDRFCIWKVIIFSAISILYAFTLLNYAAPQVNAEQMGKNPPVQQIGPDEYKIGGLTLNKSRKEIYIPGSINMQKGLVEYLACQAEIGKLHESVLQLEVKPADVQIALLLLGLKPKNNLTFQGDPTAPEGDPLEIWVEWELADKTRKKVRAEELVFDQKKEKPMDKTYWIYTGSEIVDGKFMADVEGSIIATFHDPVALINNPLPGGGDDTVYICHEKLLPPQGTKVLLTVRVVEVKSPEDSPSDKLLNAKKGKEIGNKCPAR